MPIETFMNPQIIANLLRGDQQAVAQQPTQSLPTFRQEQAAMPHAPIQAQPMLFDQPFQTSFAQGLVDRAVDPRDPVGHWAEGAGRLAMLASGYYHRAQDDKRARDREASTAQWIDKSVPDLSDAYRLGDTETRKAIAKAARDTIMSRAEDRRLRQQTATDIEAAEKASGGELDTLRALAGTGRPEAAKAYEQALIKRSALKDETLKAEREYERTAARERAKFQEKVENLKRAGYGEQDAIALAQGIPPEKLRLHREGAGDYYDNYELLATDKDSYKVARSEAGAIHKKAFEETQKNFAQAVRTMGSLENLDLALKRVGYTGYQGEAAQELRKMYAAITGSDKSAGAGDMIRSIQLDLAKGARTGFPGSVSNKEMEWYLQSVPSLANTPEGNKLIMDVLRYQIGQHIALRDDWEEFRKMRKAQGREALMAEGFTQFANERAAKRFEGLRLRIAQAMADDAARKNAKNATSAFRPPQDAAPQQVQPTTPRQGAPAQGLPGPRARGPDGRVYRVMNGQWVPVDE